MKIPHIFRGLVPLAVAASLLAGCGDSNNDQFVFTNSPNPQPPVPTPVDPTAGPMFTMYMVGSDLESEGDAGTDDFDELVDGLAQMTQAERDQLSIVIAFGGAEKNGWRGMKWMNKEQLVADSQDGIYGNETAPGSYLFQDDAANMGEPGSLTKYLNFLATQYPNKTRVMVDLWNHGGSYEGFGFDQVYDNRGLSLPEIDASFANSGLPVIDLIGFDACLMASMEAAKSVQGHARLLVASEELEPGHGWNYRYVPGAFVRSATADAFARGLVDDYVDSANHPGDPTTGKTLSVLDLAQVPQVIEALDAYSNNYRQGLATVGPLASAFARAVTEAQAFGANPDGSRTSIDLRDFLTQSQFYGPGLVPDASALRTALDNLVDYTNDDGSVRAALGVAIIPPDLTGRNTAENLFPGSGWFNFSRNVISLILADTAGPQLLNLVTTDDGIVATFVDGLLTRVQGVYGLREADGSLLKIGSIEARALAAPSQWSVPEWTGEWLHLAFAPGQVAVPVPLTYSREAVDEETGEEVGIFQAQVEFYDASETDPSFESGVLDIALNAEGEVVAYSLRTKISTPSGDIDDKTVESIDAGDRLRLFTNRLQVGSQDEPAYTLFGNEMVFLQEAAFSRQLVVPAAGSTLGYGIYAQDLADNVTLSEIQDI